MTPSSYVRRKAHRVGVEITVDYLEIFERGLTGHLREDVVVEARDDFIG
jgi:hypothetical protein